MAWEEGDQMEAAAKAEAANTPKKQRKTMDALHKVKALIHLREKMTRGAKFVDEMCAKYGETALADLDHVDVEDRPRVKQFLKECEEVYHVGNALGLNFPPPPHLAFPDSACWGKGDKN